MTGLPGIRLAPELRDGPREALVIATAIYQDPDFHQLRASADDADELAGVLGDPNIGAFTVTSVVNGDDRQIRRTADVFLSSRGTGDLVVVYLSCHGLLDRRGRLYFAATDTLKTQLGSTGIPSVWLLDQLDECRARRQVLILDCCFSGAFAHGMKGPADLDLERRLSGQGRSRAVLTASRAAEYSFEGQALTDAAVRGSVFTAGLVEGLRTGAADADGDGYISLDEAYDYAYGYVTSRGASQTPQRWLSGYEGTIVLARSPAGIANGPALSPEDLAASRDSRFPPVRTGAVNALGEAQAEPGTRVQATQPERAKIFLCYRREDTKGFARGIYQSLAGKYGQEQVFRDIDSTPAGVRFSTWIESRVGQCSVMIVLIGNAWSSAKDQHGQRRLDLPKDWVRHEIETALKRGIPIIPVRVEGAPIPSEDELPPSIADLTGFQSAEVTDSRWDFDVGLLIQAIDSLIASY